MVSSRSNSLVVALQGMQGAEFFLLLLILMVPVRLASSAEQWTLQSAFVSTLPVLGEAGARFATQVSSQSGGALTVEFLEPGVVAEATDAVAAVARGDVEAAYTTAGFSTGEIPAIIFFSAVPFGAEGVRQFQWVRSGAGRALFDEFYSRLGVKALPCAMTGPDGGGWFRDPVNSVSDFDGLKMRIFGLGADVIQRLGAMTVLLAGADILPALKAGTIDAAEFSTPYIDETFNFDQVATNYYYPSWHQRHQVLVVVVNPNAWQSLSSALQNLVESVCDDNVLYTIKEDEALTGPALVRLQNRGVVVREFSGQITSAAQHEWRNLAAQKSSQDQDFDRVYRAYQAFLVAPVVIPILQGILLEN